MIYLNGTIKYLGTQSNLIFKIWQTLHHNIITERNNLNMATWWSNFMARGLFDARLLRSKLDHSLPELSLWASWGNVKAHSCLNQVTFNRLQVTCFSFNLQTSGLKQGNFTKIIIMMYYAHGHNYAHMHSNCSAEQKMVGKYWLQDFSKHSITKFGFLVLPYFKL